MENREDKSNISNFTLTENKQDNSIKRKKSVYLLSIGIPLIIVVLVSFGLIGNFSSNSHSQKNYSHSEIKGTEIKNAGKYNILSSQDLTSQIKDTVYTDKNCWLELRIDQQTLYQHWRDGRTEKYPVSTGNNHSGDPKALESRPGLFTIFLKEEHHISTQFEAADMYNYMPFNQGIGFHALNGTGYYGSLGIRPASHGCIRMKHEDVKKLYGECDIGTLVLASKGYSARTVAFAPKGFENEKVYTKDEYKKMFASNLYNLLNGKYYMEEKERFVVDPKIIPTSGIYTSYDVKIPERQIIPRSYLAFFEKPDRLAIKDKKEILPEESSEEFVEYVSNDNSIQENNTNKDKNVSSTEDLIKKYFNNPIGILPYFGPKK